MSDLSVSAISELLDADADTIARELLPGGKPEGREWKCRASASPTGAAVSVVTAGSKRGLVAFWNDEVEGGDGRRHEGGDLLDLYRAVTGEGMAGAVAWAKHRLGIEDTPRRSDNGEAERRRREIEATARQRAEEREREEEASAARRLEIAERIWSESRELLGTPAEAYLRHRGITRRDLPPTLRYHAGLRHPEGGTFPALVGCVESLDGDLAGVWRIFVRPDGAGKAPVENAKLGLGNVRGGAVRLGAAGDTLAVTEGIETGLAVVELTAGRVPVWAALSTSGIKGLDLPDTVRRIVIFPDGDPLRELRGRGFVRPGRDAAQALIERARGEGRSAAMETPPPDGCDFLDVLNARRKRAA